MEQVRRLTPTSPVLFLNFLGEKIIKKYSYFIVIQLVNRKFKQPSGTNTNATYIAFPLLLFTAIQILAPATISYSIGFVWRHSNKPGLSIFLTLKNVAKHEQI